MTITFPPVKNSPSKQSPKISFVSLGCPKALVDSERLITQLRTQGYQLSPTHTDADVVIVNTCGFLNSAKVESLEAIGKAMEENGRVIVTGCMGAKPEQITNLYPDLIAVTGPQAYEGVLEAIHSVAPLAANPFIDLIPPQGIKLTPRHYAYLKISEGCNHHCTFCIIPDLRGRLVSSPVKNILQEAETLVQAGVKELLIISQDTSAYGMDLNYAISTFKNKEIKARFFDIVQALGEFGVWVRLHYVYPYPHVDEVIPLMVEGKILPYLDIPFQHASPSVLKRMRRPAHQEKTLERISSWRKICPDLTIRSTFIVGFPGETEDDFQMLLDWLSEAKIDRVGCFKFEPVAGGKASSFEGQISDLVKEERWNRLMAHQQLISDRRQKEKIGMRLQVIIDEGGSRTAKGRTKGDAPEIDGCVHMTSRYPLRVGDIVTVLIQQADAYDLQGIVVG